MAIDYLETTDMGRGLFRAINIRGAGDVITFEDHFIGDTMNPAWTLLSGSDDAVLDPAITTAIGGVCRLTTGDSAATTAVGASQLSQGLIWQASNGNLILEARLKLSAITDIVACIGFTDNNGLEIPFELNTTTLTSTASNATCFLFDTGATNDNWHCAGVASDTDATLYNTGVAPVAGTYQKFRLELSSAGTALFYIDGNFEATMTSAITAATDVTPIIVARNDTTSSRNVDVDRILIAMDE